VSPYVSAAQLVEELRQFTAGRWLGEPTDVARLRSFSLPPMGNLPCVLYCNFDLFWAGEQLQVCRQAALDGDLRLPELAEVTGLLLERTAARTAKWEMPETVMLLRRAAEILREWRPDTAQEFAVVIEHLLMAVNRIQSAVDAIIPWNELDGAVRLRATT
jgi:hypothetical protein